MKLEQMLDEIELQDENTIDTSKGKRQDGISQSIVDVIKAVKEVGRDKITLTSKMFEVDFISKQTVYNALKSLGMNEKGNGNKQTFPCKFIVKENSLKPSSEVIAVNVWGIQGNE